MRSSRTLFHRAASARLNVDNRGLVDEELLQLAEPAIVDSGQLTALAAHVDTDSMSVEVQTDRCARFVAGVSIARPGGAFVKTVAMNDGDTAPFDLHRG